MTENIRLNSLDKFRKQPDMLVLEEHSHCEVPAGCGGVILRWRNPKAGLPVTAYLYTPVEAVCYLDGNKLETARLELAAGRHVMGVSMSNVEISRGLLMFAAVHEPKEHQLRTPQRVKEPVLKVLSDNDKTWRFSLEQPPDDWKMLAFDDQNWPALTRMPTPEPAWDAFGAAQFWRCKHAGAACLGVPGLEPTQQTGSWWFTFIGRGAAKPPTRKTNGIWIRRVFEVPETQFLDAENQTGQP
jgi:hypothetical protein